MEWPSPRSLATLSLVLLGLGFAGHGFGSSVFAQETTLSTQHHEEHVFDSSVNDMKQCACATARVMTDYYCPLEYQWVLGGCFMVNSYTGSGGRTDWSNTRLACQALHGDLASINDLKRFAAYIAIFHDDGAGNPDVWIGAKRNGDVFNWLNGTIIPSDSPLWSHGHPRELGTELKRDCVFLDGNGQLRSAGCQYDKHSICEYLP